MLVKPAPRDFIESFVGGSDYWANGIRKEYRTTNPDHIAFCDTFKALLLGLMDYVKSHHATGLSWNAKGGDVNDYKEGATSSNVAAPVASTPAPAASPASGASSSVQAFDAYCEQKLNPFVAACNKLGGDAQPAGEVIREAWGEMKRVLVMSMLCKEPSQAQLQGVFASLSAKMKSAGTLVKRNEWEKHTKTVSEGVGCLNW